MYDLGVSREDVMYCITKGVKEAFLTAMEAGDGWNGPIIRDYILEKIKEGASQAFSDYKLD